MSAYTDLVARLMARPGPAAPAERRRARTGTWPRMEPWRATSRQVCGLWPLVVSSATPMVGAPLGAVINGGTGTVCADHIAWFEQGLISAPSAMVLGLNGLGKTTLVQRLITAQAYRGVHSMVLGDIKPDYVDLVDALGGQVITIGHGRAGINPLDAGNVAEAAVLLSDHPQERRALLAAAHERKKTMVLSLVQIIRRQPPTNREENILGEAIRLLDERGGQPVLADLLDVIRQAPPTLRAAALDRGDARRYAAVTEELEISLMALMSGRLGAIFAERTTTPMMMDRCVVFDVSALKEEEADVQAAVLLSCWSYGFATVEIAQTLADAGVAPRRGYGLVMDELWRILRVSAGMVERVDALTRLNRSIGVGQVMITHSMADLEALPSEEDRLKAAGFIERSKMLFLGGLPSREVEMLRGVMEFSKAEESLLSSWKAPGTWDPVLGQVTPPPGRGKFMLKTADAPGIPFQVSLSPAERDLSYSNQRWSMRQEAGA